MSAVLGISWAIMLIIAAQAIRVTYGNAGLVAMFPEGRRWWMPWSRLLALAVFAAVVLWNPFIEWTVR